VSNEQIIFVLIGILIVLAIATIARLLYPRKAPSAPGAEAQLEALRVSLQMMNSAQSDLSRNLQSVQMGLLERLEKQGVALQDVKNKLDFASHGQGEVQRKLEETFEVLGSLRTATHLREKLDEANRNSLARLEKVMAGSYSKGKSGENILHEALKVFPREMMDYDFQVKGKVVEFGLILANGKRLAIDCKWTASSLLEELDTEEEPRKRQDIVKRIENQVVEKVKEVCQYIDPAITFPWAAAAIPDSAFAVCRQAHLESYRKNVILISYSMAVPYLLTLYSLHLQYARTLEVEQLEAYLLEMERRLGDMRTILENRIVRPLTMIQNAANEYQQLIADMTGGIAYLRSSRGEEKGLEAGKQELP
jgi:hypothetical protein